MTKQNQHSLVRRVKETYYTTNMAMETLSENVPVSLLLVFVIGFCICYIFRRQPTGIPPFPATPLPVFGNLFSLEKDPRRQLAKWRQEYGDIFSLYFGSQLVIVLNGFDCVREAFVDNADMFSDRPKLALYTLAFRNQGISVTSGRLWKSQRKFTLTALRDFGFGRNSMEGKIVEEVEHIVKYFESKQGKKQDFNYIYNISTSNIICSLMFGRRFEYDEPIFLESCKAMHTILEALSNTGLGTSFPCLQYLPGDLTGIKSLLKSIKFIEEKFIKPEIESHVEEYDGTAKDFVSAYIKEIKERESTGQDATEFKENLTQTIRDLFDGGTETTAVILKWLILFLIHFPDVQEKCFQEIRDNIGLDKLPELKDKKLLPYVQATLAETSRRANIVPLGVFHAVAEDTTFHGYRFPKGVTVMPNMDSIFMDPKVWPNPEDFLPERFINKDGEFFKPETFIPFSIGRRVCLGKALAEMELFLIGATLIQKFQFLIPEDEPLPTLEPVMDMMSNPVPYEVKAVPRN